jgi:iron complex outermembrane receptor protein
MRFIIWGSALSLSVASTLAHAQQTPQNAAQAGVLEEVIVTAQRRDENLQRAAVAVSAISGDALLQAGVTQPTDLSALVPALQVSTAAGPYTLFYLRGVGSFNGNALSDSTVAFNIDNVYVARPSSSAGFFYDLERVEVLKGPQGTLYGRNATGGAINVISRKPEVGSFAAEATIDVGNEGYLQVNGALNVPLGESAAARLAIQSVDHDAYMSDGTDDQEDRAARVQLRFEPSDDLSINVSADFYDQGGVGVGNVILSQDLGDERIGVHDQRSADYISQLLIFPAGDFLNPLPNDSFLDNQYWGTHATIEWRTDAGTLTVIPAWREGELDYRSYTPGFFIRQLEKDEQASIEARFASSEDQPLRWLLGVYGLAEDIDVTPSFNQQYNASWQQFSTSTDSWAAFGRVTFAISDAVRLTGGLRYTQDDKSFEGRFRTAQVLCPGAFIPPPAGPQFCFGGSALPYGLAPPAQIVLPDGSLSPFTPWVGGQIVTAREFTNDQSENWDSTTWRAALEWDVSDRSLFYASVETGFKAGGFFFTIDDPTYEPEEITAYTIGSKNRFLEDTLQLNAEVFYWDYKDQQISHLNLDSAGTAVFATENVGSATVQGIELELMYLAGRNTLLRADVQYLDAEYDDFVYNVPNFGAPPVADCPSTPAGTVFSVDCSGKTPPQSPEWTVNLGLEQTFPLSSGARIIFQVGTHYQSETLTGLEFLDSEKQDAYWMSNAALMFNSPEDRWSVAAYVDNIEDETVLASSFPEPLAGQSLVTGTLRPPLTYGVRLTAKF